MVASEQLADQAGRLVDRLRSLPEARLARTAPGQVSIAQSAHALAQVLADLVADLEGRPPREVPALPDLAVGDQVAVMVNDLVRAVDSAGTFSDVVDAGTAGNDRVDPGVALDVALAAVAAMRAQA